MSDFIDFPEAEPIFRIAPEIFAAVEDAAPVACANVLLSRSLDVIAVQHPLPCPTGMADVVRAASPFLVDCLEVLSTDQISFQYDTRPVKPGKAQRSPRWHLDAYVGNSFTAADSDSTRSVETILGMDVLPPLSAVGRLPLDHALVRNLDVRPARTRRMLHDDTEAAIKENALEPRSGKAGWGSRLTSRVLHKGDIDTTTEPMNRVLLHVREV